MGFLYLSIIVKKIILVASLFSISYISSFCQPVTAVASGSWNNPATWNNDAVPGAGDNVIINSGITVTVDGIADVCLSLTINSPTVANGITISGTNSLAVSGAITMNAPASAGVISTISVGTGTLSAAGIAIPGSAVNGENCIVSVSTGTINITGNITFSGTPAQAQFIFTGAGTLYIAGNLGGGGTFTNSTGIVNFNGTIPQTFAGYNYNILKSNNTAGITPVAAPSISTLTIADLTPGSLFNDGGFTITSANTLNLNSGTYNCTTATFPWSTLNAGSGTVNYSSAGAQTIYNTTYDVLTLSGGNTKTIHSAVIANILNFNGATTLAIGANSLTANAVNRNNAIAVTISTGTFNVNGNLSLTNSDPITFSGAGTINVSGNLTCGNITLNAGTMNITGILSCAALTGNSGIINIGGNFNPTTYTINTSTVNYNSSSAQNITGIGYFNLVSSGGGSKSLQGNTTVAGNLNLNSGVIQLSNYNLTLTGTTGLLQITGSFSNTNMIETNGNGLLIFSNANLIGADLNGTYPVGNIGAGSNPDYNPVLISGLTGAAANRTFSIGVYTGQLFVDGINRYWLINQTGVTGTPSLSFTYVTTESSSDFTKYQPYTNISGSWALAPSASATGINPVTSVLTAALPTTSEWTASIPGAFYSYQSGNWNNPTTWTNDPSGTTLINPLNTYPGDLDAVTILPGRTVTLTANVTSASNNITINGGGFLNLSNYQFTNSLLSLGGQGTLQISPSNPVTGYFPVVTTNTFINTGGGTVEYDVNTNLPLSPVNYNNLTINSPTGIVTLVSNISLNGNLWIEQGTFQINDNISAIRRQLTINGNVTVNTGASFTVGTGNTTTTTVPTGINTTVAGPFINYYDGESHRVVVNGNFINNGTVRFTNQTYPTFNAFPSNGIATVYFRGSTNNTLTCNGITDFYNFILDKGTDQTYLLTVYSSAFNNCRLFGANTAIFDISMGASNANPNLKKALWVRNGTLNLTGLIAIPSLTEGSVASATTGVPSSDYFIPSNGAIVLNDPFVIILATADDTTEVNAAYGLSGGNGALYGINASGAGSGLSILGNLQVNNGYLSTRESSGILYWSYASGQFIINGGTVDTKQFHNPEGGATGLISYSQTGGNVIFRGRFKNTINYTSVASLTNPVINTARDINGGTDATAGIGTFSINSNAGNGFAMSGGTMTFYDVCGTASPTDAVYIGCPTSNINVTGGTIQVIPTTGTLLPDAVYIINTLAPIGNLNINQASGNSKVQLNTNITVLQNLTLQSGTFDANMFNVGIGGNFSIASGTNYLCTGSSANRTIFNGTGTQTFTINLNSPLALNRLILRKSSASTLVFAGTQNTVNLADSLMIVTGKLNDNGNVINASGGIYNAGNEYGTGKIAMVGTNPQTIDGNGSGIFNNLDINNTNSSNSPVSLTAAITLNGTLNLALNKIFTIGTFNLLISSTGSITSIPGFSNTCFIQANGKVGDGGITKVYTNTTPFTFPLGAFSTNRPASYAYTPATIGFTIAPSVYGSLTVIPVGIEDPNTTTKNLSLTYYWHVVSSGFTLTPNSVTQSYTFAPADVNSTLSKYVPARFNNANFTWTSGTTGSINTSTYTMGLGPGDPFFYNVSYLDGDYTAGNNNPVNPFGTPKIFYSYHCPAPAGGLWDNSAIWSLASHTVYSNPSNIVPGAIDIVIIGNKDSVYLGRPVGATQYTAQNFDVRNCATLIIESGSALDIGYNTNCNFNVVANNTLNSLGNGDFRLTTSWNSGSTFLFPLGDFSSFNQNLGTEVLYSTNNNAGTTFWLPQTVNSYGNLIISPLGGSNIIFGNLSINVFGNVTINGTDPTSWFLPTWNSNYPTPPALPVTKTIKINGNLILNGGAFGWYGGGTGGAQNLIVNGNIIIGALSGIDVWSGNTSQSISIGGNLINNTTGTYYGDGYSYSRCNFTNAPVTFFGNFSSTISNTSGTPVTMFGNVTINKGNSQATTLTCNVGGTLTTPADNWLNLQNGTFIYNSQTNLQISTTTSFSIPSSAGLNINTPNNVIIGTAQTTTNPTLNLNGKLTLASTNTGTVFVGPNATTAYHDDIEYSSGGGSTIEADGGSLVVNGAIRRNPSDAAGVLSYTQTGNSSVTINGNSALNTNAKLEVFNNGSQFSMSGTPTLTIVRGGGGNSFGDVYLRPQSGSVTGGTILFGQNAAAIGNQVYQLDANIPLNNITVSGFNAATTAKVQLMVDSLIVNGNMTINANSSLNAVAVSNNNIDINFNGNLINNGTYNYGNNNTIFSASNSSSYLGVQGITGLSTTNFNNLIVNPGSSLTINGNTSVNNLSINSGTLICGNNKMSVSGSFTNNGNYTDKGTNSSGIGLTGTSPQQVSGTGSFGWLELNNASGAILNNNITLNESLTMTSGILNIQQNLLTLQQNSNIYANVTPFSVNKMITTNAVLGNTGINKFFTTTPQTFVYPIGTSGKYTPAILTVTASGYVGSVRINPVNTTQPTVLDPTNALKFYWDIQSSGISGFQGTMTLHYLSSDVVGGPESSYQTAWLISPGTSWSINEGPVYPTPGDSMQFNYPAGTENLSGEYTAGLGASFPAIVPTYTSNNNGAWNNPAIWTQTGGTTHILTTGPNGFIVIIQSNDTVTASTNNCSAYQTTINGKLVVNAGTYGQNFGNVTGNGTLTLQSGLFPAGNYTTFLSCLSGGTLEYGGTGNYTIIADLYNSIPNILFSGTGTRILPDKALTICNSLVIGKGTDNPVVDNSIYNQHLTIEGTMQYYSGTFKSGTGTNATVTFTGSSAQTIGGITGNFTGNNAFNNFEINNSAGLTINNGGAIAVNGNLLLTNGLINTKTNNTLTITNTATNCVIPAGGSTNSYVNGPLSKLIIQGDNFLFPIGQGVLSGNRVSVSSTQTGPITWTAQYFNPNPTYTSYSSPLTVVSWNEYWAVTPASASQAIINLNYYPNSDITPLVTPDGLSDMCVATFNSSLWNAISSTASGNNNYGTVYTNSVVSLPNTPTNFTLAAIENVIPKAKLSPTGPVCGTAGIPVTFSAPTTIPLNYILTYTVNSGSPQTVNINSTSMLPYSLPTMFGGPSAVYSLTGFTYGGGTGVVDPTPVTAYATPPTSNAGLNQSVCGITSVNLNGDNPAPYTGLWSVISGTGGTVITPNNPTSQFDGILPNSYTLQWTISNGQCQSISDVSIAFTTRPTQPVALSPQSFCNAAVISNIAVTAPIGTVNWYTIPTYPPSSSALSPTTALTSGSTYYADAVSGTCVSSPPLTPVTVTINPLPNITTSLSAGAVCYGNSIQNSSITYSAVTNLPTQYSIVWNAAAQAAGLVNTGSIILTASPLTVAVAVQIIEPVPP